MSFVLKISYILLIVQVVTANVDIISQKLNNTSAYCLASEEETTFITVTKTRNEYAKKYNILGFKFGKDIPKEKVIKETVPHIIKRNVTRCCPGYYEKKDGENRMCVPHCEPACPDHAECTKPNHCNCHDGYKEIRDTQQVLRCEELAALREVEEIESTEAVNEVEETTSEQILEITRTFENNVVETDIAATEATSNQTFECQFNKCPDYAECQNNSLCDCVHGYEWRELITESNDTKILCLPLDASIDGQNFEVEISLAYIVILGTVHLGVVMFIIVVAALTRNHLMNRKNKLRLKEETNKDKQIMCKYIREDEESVAVVY